MTQSTEKTYSNEATFKVKDGYILRSIAGKHMIVPTGENIANFCGIITANETAALLFSMLQAGAAIGELIQALCLQFNINSHIAKKDVNDFIDLLSKNKMLA